MFGAGFLLLGLLLLTEAVVGTDVWRRRPWRAYAWPSLAFTMGILMWPVMVFFTNSAIHMVAHGAWAQTLMLAGAAQLGLVRGKLHSRYWELTMALALFVSGAAFLIHEQNGWLFARSAFLHHAIGWTLVVGSIFPVLRTMQPRVRAWQGGLAVTVVAVAVLLFCDRNLAPIFGHLSEAAVTSAR